MGALLGQSNNANENHELGASAGDIAKDVGTFAISPIAFGIRKLGIFGGGEKCTDEDLSKRDELEAAIEALLSYQDRRKLVGYANSNISPNAREMANFAVGGVNKWGGDCYHKNVGSGDKRFLERLETMLQEKAQEAQREAQQAQQQSSSFSSSASSSQPNSGSSSNTTTNTNSTSSQQSSGNGSNNAGVPATQQSGPLGGNATTYAVIGGGSLLLILGTIALTK